MSLVDLEKRIEAKNRKKHKMLLVKDEERAIKIIKTEIPKGYKLKEYLNELRAEIEVKWTWGLDKNLINLQLFRLALLQAI